MPDFLRKAYRMVFGGVNLSNPVDDPSLAVNAKFPIAQNVRAYGLSPIETRPGLVKLSTIASAPIHSVKRLSDVLNSTFTRIAGAGTVLAYGTGAVLTQAATGFSGNPLALTPLQPDQSPDPWMYVGDSSKMAKIRRDGTTYSIGIAPPTVEPTAALGALPIVDVDTMQAVANWSADNAVLDNAGLSITARINTSVTAAIGDAAGGGAGFYTVYPAAITNIQPGTFVTFGTTGGANKLVQSISPSPFTTTVSSIVYDSGVAGPCSIVPAAPVNIAVNSLVQLNAAEYVQVQSVSLSPDGTTQSFRCTTVGTIAAAQAIVGVASFRCYCDAAPTGTIVRNMLHVKFLTSSGGVGYITKTVGLANSNLGVISGRQILADDEIHCSIQMSNLSELIEGKLMLNVDATDLTFTRNAYVWNFRPDVFQATVTNASTVLAASGQSVVNTVLDQAQPALTGEDFSQVTWDLTPRQAWLFEKASMTAGTFGQTTSPSSTQPQTGTGQTQWMELVFKVGNAQRIGTDMTRTLQTVTGIRVQLTCTGTLNTDTVDFDAWWVGGTYGPDVGAIGSPYYYRARGRSSATGARSNPGPAMRLGGGIYPHRQAVTVSFSSLTTAADASWTQADKVDIYRFGGSLTDWRYIGTVANDPAVVNTLTFSDIYPDDWVATQPLLEMDQDQPFVIIDKPRSGTCDVSGTTVTRKTGDNFNTKWAAGTIIQIGAGSSAVNYPLHGRPSSTTQLQIENSGGNQTGVVWNIYAPVLIGQSLPAQWGPLEGFTLACGDNLNAGRLYWLNGNNPDASQQASYIDVTSPSEPMMNGCMWDARAFAWSTDRMFAIFPTFEGAILTGTQVLGGTTQLLSPFRALEIPNSQGLYTRWGFAVGPVIYFLGKDGIYQTAGGQPQSITDQDLYAWFPHDGQPGKTVNGFPPPDLGYSHASTQAKDFRLAWYDDILYFDYRGTDGNLYTAFYDTVRKTWLIDKFGRTVVMHYGELGTKDGFSSFPGASFHELLLGGTDGAGSGAIFQNTGTDDDGVAIACHVRTPSLDMDEPWLDKQFGDIMVDIDRGGRTVTVTPGVNNYGTTVAPTAISSGAGRQQYIVGGAATVGRNLALDITWSGSGPLLYIWEPSFLLHSYLQNALVSLVQANGKSGYQHMRDAYLAHISSANWTFTVTVDNVAYSYTIPSSGGIYKKYYLVTGPLKGKAFQFSVSGSSLRFINSDSRIRVKGWGESGAYTEMVIPFDSGARL